MNKNEPHPFITAVLLLGMFGGSILMVYLMGRTFLTIDMAALYVLCFGAVTFGVHFLFFSKGERYLTEVILYCLGGWGILLTTGMLGLNFIFHSKPVANSYVLKNKQRLNLAMMPAEFEITIEDSAFNDFGYLLTFHETEIKENGYADEAVLTTARGIFGYDIILKKELR